MSENEVKKKMSLSRKLKSDSVEINYYLGILFLVNEPHIEEVMCYSQCHISFSCPVLTSFLVPTTVSESLKGNSSIINKKVLTKKQPVLFIFGRSRQNCTDCFPSVIKGMGTQNNCDQ